MAENKNQHFVPRCYLKPFSQNGDGKAINVLNVDTIRHYPWAPLKNQCSRDYFYGRDPDRERAIKMMEDMYASILSRVTRIGYELNSKDSVNLLRFWLFQYLRTEEASRRYAKLTEDMMYMIDPKKIDFRLEMQRAVDNALDIFVKFLDRLDDLKICLVSNATCIPFVTSDDPAVMTNEYFLARRPSKILSFGLSASGLLVFLPLTPKIFMIGYDGDVYRIPKTGGWIRITQPDEVHALNEHQFLKCRANIYFRDSKDVELVASSFRSVSSLRINRTHRLTYLELSESGGGAEIYRTIDRANAKDHGRHLVHMQAVYPQPSRWPGLLEWRRDGVGYSDGSAAGFIRKAEASRIFGANYRKLSRRLMDQR